MWVGLDNGTAPFIAGRDSPAQCSASADSKCDNDADRERKRFAERMELEGCSEEAYDEAAYTCGHRRCMRPVDNRKRKERSGAMRDV